MSVDWIKITRIVRPDVSSSADDADTIVFAGSTVGASQPGSVAGAFVSIALTVPAAVGVAVGQLLRWARRARCRCLPCLFLFALVLLIGWPAPSVVAPARGPVRIGGPAATNAALACAGCLAVVAGGRAGQYRSSLLVGWRIHDGRAASAGRRLALARHHVD